MSFLLRKVFVAAFSYMVQSFQELFQDVPLLAARNLLTKSLSCRRKATGSKPRVSDVRN